MEIQINNQNLDFTIEHDETLGEVVQDIKNWLEGSDLVLYSVKHEDCELLSTPYEQWAPTPHHQVGTLDVTVKHAQELTLLNLQTVLEYLGMLKQGIAAGDARRLGELLPGFSALTESLHRHFPNSRTIQEGLNGLFAESDAEKVLAWEEPTRQQALKLIDLVFTQVSYRLQELQDPRAALKNLSAAMKVCIEEISEVSILLQTGKDRQAMDTIIRFSDLAQSLVRIVTRIGGVDLQEFYQELNGILSELLQAFEARDTVLIGDLMEYEVAPRLEKLQKVLEDVM